MEKTQRETNSSQEITNTENNLFKWAISALLGILFTLVGIVYNSITTATANAQSDISTLQSQQIITDSRFQNLEANVYIICQSQRLSCIPPITK